MGDTPGRKVRRDDSFGYCFQGDVNYKYSRESRTGNSFSETRKKVINRPHLAALEALPTVGGEDSYGVFEHSTKKHPVRELMVRGKVPRDSNLSLAEPSVAKSCF